MADKRKHRQMTSAEQARYSESRYGRGAAEARPATESRQAAQPRAVAEPRPMTEPRTSRRTTSGRPAGAHMAPSRAEGVEAYRQRRRKKGAGRVLKVLLVTVLVVLAGAGTAVGLWLADLNGRLADKNVVSDDLRQQLVAVEPQEPFYMLLLGVDKSEGRAEEWGADTSNFRADTIILTRVDAPAQKVTLVSIPRDTLVDMGANGERKINDAYAIGGAAYMTKIVSEFADVDISHYAEVDFEQLTSIVDTIGGIEVTLPVAIHDDYAVIDLPAGTQTIDGATALGLCRARHAYDDYGGGDFYRAANQRMVIGAIVKKVLQLGDIATMATTVSELADSVSTDFSATDILSLVAQFRSFDVDNNMFSGQTPTVSEYINNIWYEIPNQAAWEEMMARVDAGESPYSDASQDFTAGVAGSIGSGPNITEGEVDATSKDSSEEAETVSDVTPVYSGSVFVLNGAGISGLGASTADTLNYTGFYASSDNASSFGNTTTTIYYNGSAEGVAAGVAKTLGLSSSHIRANDGTYSTEYDVIVLLGEDMG